MSKKKESDASKEAVKLRERVLANGNRSLYLDIYRDGKRMREFLKMYLVPEVTKADREKNRVVLEAAQMIKMERTRKLLSKEYDFKHQFSPDTPFLTYYRNMCQDRFKEGDYNGNWGNWHSCLKYLEMYCDETTTFKEVDKEWILGFKDLLDHVSKDTHKKQKTKEGSIFVGLSQNTKLSYFNKLRACINDAFNHGIMPYNPMIGVEGFKEPETEREYLTIDELQKLINTPCKNPWLRAAFLFACFTGLRISDIQQLTWGEVQKFGDYDRIVFNQQKTNGLEYLDINPQARELMGDPQGPFDRVFPGFNYSSDMRLELRRWVLAAGIPKDITFHCSRHTFAVMMLTLGAEIYTVSKLLGHRNLSTTQIYAKVVDKKKQEAISLIPQFNKPTETTSNK